MKRTLFVVIVAALLSVACGSESVVGPSAMARSSTHDSPAERLKSYRIHGTVAAPGSLFYRSGDETIYGNVSVLDSDGAWHFADITEGLTFDVNDVAAGPFAIGVYSYGYRTWYRELELLSDVSLDVTLEAKRWSIDSSARSAIVRNARNAVAGSRVRWRRETSKPFNRS